MSWFHLAMDVRPLLLLWMVLLFLWVVVRSLAPGGRTQHAANARIPLQDDPRDCR